MNRRQWVVLSAGTLAASRSAMQAQPEAAKPGPSLPLEQYQPKNMLHLSETQVPRSAFPETRLTGRTREVIQLALTGRGEPLQKSCGITFAAPWRVRVRCRLGFLWRRGPPRGVKWRS